MFELPLKYLDLITSVLNTPDSVSLSLSYILHNICLLILASNLAISIDIALREVGQICYFTGVRSSV